MVPARAGGEALFIVVGSTLGDRNEALGRLTTPAQFADIIVKTDAQGRVTRIGDVARVELGAQDYTTNAYMNEKNAVAPECAATKPFPSSFTNASKSAR